VLGLERVDVATQVGRGDSRSQRLEAIDYGDGRRGRAVQLLLLPAHGVGGGKLLGQSIEAIDPEAQVRGLAPVLRRRRLQHPLVCRFKQETRSEMEFFPQSPKHPPVEVWLSSFWRNGLSQMVLPPIPSQSTEEEGQQKAQANQECFHWLCPPPMQPCGTPSDSCCDTQTVLADMRSYMTVMLSQIYDWWRP